MRPIHTEIYNSFHQNVKCSPKYTSLHRNVKISSKTYTFWAQPKIFSTGLNPFSHRHCLWCMYGVRRYFGLPRNVDKFYLTPIFGDYDQRCDRFLNQGKMTQYLLETSATAFPPTSCFRSRTRQKRQKVKL